MGAERSRTSIAKRSGQCGKRSKIGCVRLLWSCGAHLQNGGIATTFRECTTPRTVCSSASLAAEVLVKKYHNVSAGIIAVMVIVYAVGMYLLVHWLFP